jgi:hypothetical protein
VKLFSAKETKSSKTGRIPGKDDKLKTVIWGKTGHFNNMHRLACRTPPAPDIKILKNGNCSQDPKF